MAKKTDKIEDLDLGLGPELDTTPEVDPEVQKVKDAASSAAATAALKVAIDASSELEQRHADKSYIMTKKKHMLNKAKNDEEVVFVGQKVFADIFGKNYTFLYNGVPVTIKFDGSKQKLPKFIYDFVMDKINKVSESNTPTDETVKID